MSSTSITGINISALDIAGLTNFNSNARAIEKTDEDSSVTRRKNILVFLPKTNKLIIIPESQYKSKDDKKDVDEENLKSLNINDPKILPKLMIAVNEAFDFANENMRDNKDPFKEIPILSLIHI